MDPLSLQSFLASLPDSKDLLRSIFDAIPSFVFVVDEDVRLIECNDAGASLLPAGREKSLTQRGGEAFHCLYALEVPEGCGRGRHCHDCRVRNAVTTAFQGGNIARCRTRLQLVRGGTTQEVHALITTSPLVFEGKRLVILVIEDISELMELRRIIPICCVCKKIRDDKNFWSKVESYLAQHMDVDFSHGLCPDCFAAELNKLEDKDSPPLRRE